MFFAAKKPDSSSTSEKTAGKLRRSRAIGQCSTRSVFRAPFRCFLLSPCLRRRVFPNRSRQRLTFRPEIRGHGNHPPRSGSSCCVQGSQLFKGNLPARCLSESVRLVFRNYVSAFVPYLDFVL